MEFSSPLAAMQPPPRPFGFGRDITNVPRPRHNPFGKANFNFRDLSMKRPSSDYFSLKSGVRGSSPTASLAADLSQNFHIDQRYVLHSQCKAMQDTGIGLMQFLAHSYLHHGGHYLPQACLLQKLIEVRSWLFIVRASLANMCGALEGATTPPIVPLWEGVTTPPIPSSSPCYAGDSMDISPLPHKAPFSFVHEVNVQSPTPEPTPDEDMTSPCEPVSNNSFQFPLGRPLEYAIVLVWCMP
jgi:M-phase inducer tyrosine phosphatase